MEDDMMLEYYLLKHSDVDVDNYYTGQDVEVMYNTYTGEFEII